MEIIASSSLDEYLGTFRLGVRFQTQENKLQLWQNKINGTTIPYYYFKHG